MKRRATHVIVAAFAAVVVFSSDSSANHSWGGYHWARTANPFTLKAGDNVDSRWDAHVAQAIADWSASDVMDVVEVAGGTRPRQCRPTAGRIEVCNASYGSNGWLGLASIWLTNGHISQATTKLNDSYFDTPTYNTPAWRQFVACQEIGHDFGLAHQDENFNNPNLGSCMDYTSDPDGTINGQLSNEHPNAHDYEELDIIYNSHLDGFTTIGAALPRGTSPAMGDIDPEGPGSWGHLVSSSRNGRAQVYELDFGNGHKILTSVFWADPAADARR